MTSINDESWTRAPLEHAIHVGACIFILELWSDRDPNGRCCQTCKRVCRKWVEVDALRKFFSLGDKLRTPYQKAHDRATKHATQRRGADESQDTAGKTFEYGSSCLCPGANTRARQNPTRVPFFLIIHSICVWQCSEQLQEHCVYHKAGYSNAIGWAAILVLYSGVIASSAVKYLWPTLGTGEGI